MMKLLDDLIVTTVTCFLRGVFVIGTGLAYIQFLALALAVAMLCTAGLAYAVVAIRMALSGPSP